MVKKGQKSVTVVCERPLKQITLSNIFFTHPLIEQSNDDQRSAKRALICAANPHNITPIYPQLMEFIGVIEAALKPDPGTNCTLYAFLMDYIKDVFLGQIRVDNGDALNSASVSLDSWKAITDSDILRDLGVQRPLLQSSVDIKKSIGK